MAENPHTARRICVLSILLLICAGRVPTAGGSAIPIPQEPVMTTRFYISPQGDDAWSGQLAEPNAERSDGPFRTIDRAQTAVPKLKMQGALAQPVRIALHGGAYFLDDPLTFTAEDSGVPGNAKRKGA